MPQLDISTFPSQLVWLLITFGVLFLVLWRVAVPRIGSVLEERKRRVDHDLERATALKAEAEAAIAAYEKAMIEARSGAREILRQAGDALAKESERRQAALGEKLAEQIKAGEERIQQAKRAALAEVQVVAADLARAAAERLAGVAVDEGRAASAVRHVLGDERT